MFCQLSGQFDAGARLATTLPAAVCFAWLAHHCSGTCDLSVASDTSTCCVSFTLSIEPFKQKFGSRYCHSVLLVSVPMRWYKWYKSLFLGRHRHSIRVYTHVRSMHLSSSTAYMCTPWTFLIVSTNTVCSSLQYRRHMFWFLDGMVSWCSHPWDLCDEAPECHLQVNVSRTKENANMKPTWLIWVTVTKPTTRVHRWSEMLLGPNPNVFDWICILVLYAPLLLGILLWFINATISRPVSLVRWNKFVDVESPGYLHLVLFILVIGQSPTLSWKLVVYKICLVCVIGKNCCRTSMGSEVWLVCTHTCHLKRYFLLVCSFAPNLHCIMSTNRCRRSSQFDSSAHLWTN